MGKGKRRGSIEGIPRESSLLLSPAASCPVGGEIGGVGGEWGVSAAAAGSVRISPEYND